MTIGVVASNRADEAKQYGAFYKPPMSLGSCLGTMFELDRQLRQLQHLRSEARLP